MMITQSIFAGVVAAIAAVSLLAVADDRHVEMPTLDAPTALIPSTPRPSVNATQAIKHAMCRAQGLTMAECKSYELDHIIPLCLGGEGLAMENLQLQICTEWQGLRCVAGPAAVKDRKEAVVCRAYREHRLTLEQARGYFRSP